MKKGFTLLEIAIALIIIGVLAGISIPILTQLNRGKRIETAKKELETYKKRIIVFYQTYGHLPRHTATYGLPPDSLQIPTKFLRDPIKGISYLYYMGPSTYSPSDSIFVDGKAIGPVGKSAVLVCAGQNGKFDGENITPSDNRFQSYGSGDFDDILIAIIEMELETGSTSTDSCTTYIITIANRSGTTIYIFPMKSRNTHRTLGNNADSTFTNIDPNELIGISTNANFPHTQTNFFIPKKYDANGNCRIIINVTRWSTRNVPLLSLDLN